MELSHDICASVIIPVYNKKPFLSNCVDSLDKQSLSKDAFEAIFVDDGATDGSGELLDELARGRSWIKVIHKENGGVSSARNAGIDAAVGRYIFYLDADDALSPDTLSEVSGFFDGMPDDVELVTYPIVPVREGKEGRRHYRYNYLVNPGIYDLNEGDNVFICQTTMNIAVRNRYSSNAKFTFKTVNGVEFHEDLKYINEILEKSMRIGFTPNGLYYWIQNTTSTVNNVMSSFYLFENTMAMYEALFDRFTEGVPEYFQGIFVSDIGWKIRCNALFPTHLAGVEYDRALARLKQLLNKIDDDLLNRHPGVLSYHKLFFMRFKHDNSLSYDTGHASFAVWSPEGLVYAAKDVELTLNRLRRVGDTLLLFGCLKSPAFDFITDVRLELITTVEGSVSRQTIELSDSSWGYVSCHMHTNSFLCFECRFSLADSTTYRFELSVNGHSLPLRLVFAAKAACSPRLNETFIYPSWMISFNKETGSAYCISISNKKYRAEKKAIRRRFRNKKQLLSRLSLDHLQLIKYRTNRKIWLYSDAVGKTDNAWIQFLHDSQINDGVFRYYVNHGAKLPHKASGVIAYNSPTHRVLFCLADKIICSDVDLMSYSPFSRSNSKNYVDYCNAELVYLQHGVLWAHMPWYYSNDRLAFDRTVISTTFEADNLIHNYRYHPERLITAGMPRYSQFDLNTMPSKKILFCPSWRSYLVGGLTRSGRTPNQDKFIASEYYQNIQKLLNSSELDRALQQFGYELHLKLHPLFSCYRDCFSFVSDRISFAPDSIHEADYAIAVTDYSSYSFDFVYLGRSIVYFVPDEDLFYAGVSNYSRLDIPLEDAFGEYVHSPHEVVEALYRLMKNGGKPLPVYQSRMNNLFIHRDCNQCSRIYNELLQEDLS